MCGMLCRIPPMKPVCFDNSKKEKCLLFCKCTWRSMRTPPHARRRIARQLNTEQEAMISSSYIAAAFCEVFINYAVPAVVRGSGVFLRSGLIVNMTVAAEKLCCRLWFMLGFSYFKYMGFYGDGCTPENFDAYAHAAAGRSTQMTRSAFSEQALA